MTETNAALLLQATGVRRLTPESTTVFEGAFSLLHCAVKNEGLYRGVFAARLFPVRHPDRFISLRYTDQDEKNKEIGVLEDLALFPPDQQKLVRGSLSSQYHEQVVRRIYGIRNEFNLLVFDVETQRGREEFIMPWRTDRAEDLGEVGKILLDAYDNRFIIPVVNDLPESDQQRLGAFIYW
jgi:hypothetical protein